MSTPIQPSPEVRPAARTGPMTTRGKIVLGLGVVMVLLGAWIALRPLFPGVHPITPSRLLDVAFALFFVLRGLMNVRTGLRARASDRDWGEPK